MVQGNKERAQGLGALFYFRLVLGLILLGAVTLPSQATAATQCGADHIDQHVRVRFVYDGDTVILEDGRRLRIIGIDTPELGRDGNPDQEFAVAARDVVRGLLKNNSELDLRLDHTLHDVYGRLLAHVFLSDGTSLSAWLLRHGYATLLIIPPNTWNAACYQAAEQYARKTHTNIWALSRYQPIASLRYLQKHPAGIM